MQLVQRYPYNTLNAFNHFLGGNSQSRTTTAAAHNWSPAVDITEKETEFQIVADVPGLSAEDVDVRVEKHVLIVSGTRPSLQGEKNESVRNERVSGAFNRRFTLPESVDVDNISAKVENGVLTIGIPKSAEASTRQVKVQG